MEGQRVAVTASRRSFSNSETFRQKKKTRNALKRKIKVLKFRRLFSESSKNSSSITADSLQPYIYATETPSNCCKTRSTCCLSQQIQLFIANYLSCSIQYDICDTNNHNNNESIVDGLEQMHIQNKQRRSKGNTKRVNTQRTLTTQKLLKWLLYDERLRYEQSKCC